MATLTKTPGTSLFAWQTSDIASAAIVIGSTASVTTALAAMVYCWLVRATGTAFTAGWPNIRIEGSAKSSGNDAWIPLAQFQPAVGASIVNTSANGAITAGATTFTITSATNVAVGDLLFLGHTTTVANYEVVRVKAVSGTTITFEEACTNAHDNGCKVTDQAELYVAAIDLSGVTRIRAVVDNGGSGQAINAQVLMVTADSIG